MDDAAIIKADGLGTSCGDVTVHTTGFLPLSGRDQLRLEVRALDAPCGQSVHLNVYDGSSISPIGHECSGPGGYQSMLVTSFSTLSLALDNPMYASVSLQLLVTSTSRTAQPGDFQCDNGFHVDSSLTRDGNNNCGDWSDERSSEFESSERLMYIVFGSFAGGIFVVAIVATIVRCCQHRLEREEYERLASPGPVYGTIQGYPTMAPATVYVHVPPPTSSPQPSGGVSPAAAQGSETLQPAPAAP